MTSIKDTSASEATSKHPKLDGEVEVSKSETVKLALSVIDKLLAQPSGNQLYARDIRNLLDLIAVQTSPPTTTNQPIKEED